MHVLFLLTLLILPATAQAAYEPVTDPSIQVTQARPFFERVSRVYWVQVSVHNSGAQVLEGALRLVVAESNKDAQDPTGMTSSGEPYYDLLTGDDAALTAGGTLTRAVGFKGGRGQVVAEFRLERDQPPVVNQPPEITSEPVVTAQEGAPYSYPVTASDPDPGDVLTFALSGPTGMGIDPVSGLIEWSTPVAGTHTVTVTVDDGAGGNAIQSYSLEVLGALPNVVGSAAADAEATLLAAGFGLGTVTERLELLVPTGEVTAQSPAAGTPALLGDLVDIALAAEPPSDGDANIPASWEGLWRVTTVYRDRDTDAVDSVAEITDVICTDDPIGLALTELVAAGRTEAEDTACEGSASANRIEATCNAAITPLGAACTLNAITNVALVLDGDRIIGSAAWSVDNRCDLDLVSIGQTAMINGTRLGTDTGVRCTGPASSLVQRFLRNPLSMYLEETQ